MKRKLLVLAMVLAAASFATGCEKKENNNGGETTTTAAQEVKLACEASADGDKVKIRWSIILSEVIKITLTYENDAIKKAQFTETDKYASEKEAKEEYEADSKEINEALKNKGMTGSVSYSGTLVTESVTFTVAELDDKAKVFYEEIFGTIKDKKLDEAKSHFETNGYTCK